MTTHTEVSLRLPVDSSLGARILDASSPGEVFDALDASMHPYGRDHWTVYSLSDDGERLCLVLRYEKSPDPPEVPADPVVWCSDGPRLVLADGSVVRPALENYVGAGMVANRVTGPEHPPDERHAWFGRGADDRRVRLAFPRDEGAVDSIDAVRHTVDAYTTGGRTIDRLVSEVPPPEPVYPNWMADGPEGLLSGDRAIGRFEKNGYWTAGPAGGWKRVEPSGAADVIAVMTRDGLVVGVRE